MLRDLFCMEIRALLSEDDWLVAEEGYRPGENLTYESLFCLSNGYMGSRASHEEGGVRKTLPASYVHGVFDRSEAFMRELCNTPDWTKLKMYYECEPIDLEGGVLEEYLRVLDMQKGFVAKHYITKSDNGRRTQVEMLKFLSRAHPNCGALRVYVTPLNYEGLLEFENLIDATVTNFIDFPRFRVKHLKTREVSSLQGMGCYVESETRDHGLPVGTGSFVRCAAIKSRAFKPYGEVACEFFDAPVEKGQTLCVEKYAAVATGRDGAGVCSQVKRHLQDISDRGFEKELQEHILAYEKMWERADLSITGDAKLSHAVRFNIFHLMSTPSPTDNRVNIGAKLIHGEEYGGHAFWDTELFVLPFFNYVFPEIARNLTEYRYLLLPKARENARLSGYAGAKYPWESADTGEEECPSWTIDPDGTCYRCHVAEYEHHVTAAVAYGARQYALISGDESFMDSMGLEILLQTARFWVSRMVYNVSRDRYEILNVTGPDEWHEPVNNNAYTNHLARWNVLEALSLLEQCRQKKPDIYQRLVSGLRLTDKELTLWRDRAGKLFLQAEKGLIEQFDGYFQIPDACVTEWDENGMPKMPAACAGKRGMQRKILKQADVVMLLHLMPYSFDMETQRENFRYYEQRTLHRSSLSPSIHCMVGLRVGDDARAYQYLQRSAYVDLDNNQRNTREGLHAASAGGTWQCVTLGYCGMGVTPEGLLTFSPRLPKQWTQVDFRLMWRENLLRVTVTNEGVSVYSKGLPVCYLVDGQIYTTEEYKV